MSETNDLIIEGLSKSADKIGDKQQLINCAKQAYDYVITPQSLDSGKITSIESFAGQLSIYMFCLSDSLPVQSPSRRQIAEAFRKLRNILYDYVSKTLENPKQENQLYQILRQQSPK